MKKLLVLFFVGATVLFAQANDGELRLKITDPSGLGVKTTVEIQSEANQYRNTLTTDDRGSLDLQNLPFGKYQVEVSRSGFATASQVIEIRSTVPEERTIRLELSPVTQSVTVTAQNTLINPDQAGSVSQIGSNFIQSRVSSIPGRSIQDLVNSQPGWLYEGNAVLHPRGSEYQTQFVIDGIPLTDNRSPSFGPEIEADDVQSMSIYTAGIPAEYGRKMGGVVEVNTVEDSQQGFHGQAVLSGGSFDTAGAFAEGQYVWGANTFGVSASGDMTSHYLNPVVIQNYTNKGTVGDFSARYQRDLTSKDRLTMSIRHELSRYELPNEQVQETAGQLQTADNFETMGIISYEHTFSSNVVADFHGMVRDNANDFYSNPESTPVEILQHNRFREGYFRGDLTVSHGHHEIKVGVESDNMFLHENFNYNITDDSQFDPSTPLTFSFMAHRPDLEQAAYAQDLIRLGNWTINAGLRWDHYQLILNRQAVSPRFAISRYFPSANVVVHFSYDRVFQTPSFENILLSSSTAAAGLDTISLQLPVEPSEGNYYEVGVTKVFFSKLKLDTNYFRRLVDNYADDDQIDNTTISYPIAFRKAIIYGAEAKLDLPPARGFSGFLSYSYEVGNAWFPVTGGLFLGDDAVIPTSGHFPDSQDQRNTVRGRIRYQIAPRLWIAGGIQYDTGLPFDFQCDPSLTLQQCIANEVQTYGQQVIDRINFNRGRIYPSFQVNASVGADLYKSERFNVRFQVDGENLTNVVDVIDFGGLFSGNAIGPSRSFALRLSTTF
ncbi:MAG TPA: TonB-dependent receptor [Candidatus Baltobacteraceae bacterium]|nr:TonB-dependent receptor [Candidatus Baltobacteraceae bacterium]